MILPNKNITLTNSLLGLGSLLLISLVIPQTINSLWEKMRVTKKIPSYEKFILSLDLLFILNLIQLKEGIIYKLKS